MRTRPWVLLLVAVTVLLAGCTTQEPTAGAVGSTDPSTAGSLPVSSAAPATGPTPPPIASPPTPSPVFEPIDLTAAVGEARPRFHGMSTLSAGSTTPVLVAGIRSTDAEHTELHAWTSADGVAWDDQLLRLPGTVMSVEVAGDDSLTAMSGRTMTDGVQGRFLFTSTDRLNWTAVRVPAPVAHDDTPVVSVIDGAVVYLVDNDRTDGQLVVIRDGRTVRHPFSRAADGLERTPIALAGSASDIIALVYEGPENSALPAVAYRSTDVGSTWSAPVNVSGPFDAATGLVRTGSGYVVTGSSRSGPDDATAMAAWSSDDGTTWRSDAVDPAGDWDFPTADGTTDAWLSGPTVSGGAVMAAAGDEGTLRTFVYARTPDGRWTSVRPGRPADNAGATSTLAIVSAAEDASRAVVVMVTQQDQSVTVQRTSPGSGVTALRWGDEARVPDVVLDDPSDTDLMVHTRGYTVRIDTGGAWSRTVDMVPFRWSSDSGLTATSWDPPGVEDGYDVERSTAADGSEVVLWNDYDFDRSLRVVSGAFRTAPDAPWETVTGFDSDLDVQFGGLGHAEDGWYAYGATGQDQTKVRLWSSTDGQSWQAQDAIDPGHPHLVVSGACVLADGTPLAVGRSTDEAGTVHPLTVVRRAGQWTWAVHEPLIAQSLTGCATATGSTVITGQDPDGTVDLTTTDGVAVTRLDPADPTTAATGTQSWDGPGRSEPVDPDYLYRPSITDVAGGFYSIGFLKTPAFTGFVLWLSRDGETWRWVPVPADVSAGAIQARTVGPDVVVVLTTGGGPLAWRITGLTEVFA